MSSLRFGIVLLLFGGWVGYGAQDDRTWDFEDGLKGWSFAPGTCAVVVEPGNPGNHVLRITATKAHHTQFLLDELPGKNGFLLSFRVRVLKWTGAPPTVYAYGRLDGGMMRALGMSQRSSYTFCWYGKKESNPRLGGAGIGYGTKGRWVRVKIACIGDRMLAKVWADGSAEPAWQSEGRDPRDLGGRCGLGLWTSPTTPSTAEALYDDIRFVALTPERMKAFGIRLGPRPGLRPAEVPASGGVFRVAGRTGLATARMAVAFDDLTGELTNVVDLATGREFVAREPKRPLFGVRLTRPHAGESLALSSRDFRRVAIRRVGGGPGLSIEFRDHIALPVSASVAIRPEPGGGVRLQFALQNPTEWSVASVAFPRMPAPAVLGDDDADDALLMPWGGGSVLLSPGRRTQQRSADYPGSAFAQFFAYYDRTAGLYTAMTDSQGHCKVFRLECVKDALVAVNLEHRFPELPGRDIRIPYDIVLRTFTGDWRDAAAIYKQWAEQQPWCAKKLTERDDIPPFLKEGAGIIIAPITTANVRARSVGENLEKLPDLMDAYRKRTDLAHMVFVPYGWENRGTWAGINYFPTVPSDEAWVKVNAELKRRGHRTAFLTSGYWWVVKRKKTGNGPAFDDTADFERRKGMCVQKADGTVWTVNWYDRVKQFGSWRGLSAALCHGSSEARNTMKDIFLNVAGLGVPLVSFDQEIGGRQAAPCYSRSHGHPPGYGKWMWTAFRDVCKEILGAGKPLQPELGLFLENVSELAVPYMSTYWSRQFGVIDVGATGGRGIGLFSYLYHEYVTAIGAALVQGQGARGVGPDPGVRRYAFANNLVRGLIPGPFMHFVPLAGGAPWQRDIASAYFSYCRPYRHFPEYLLLGKTIPPPAVECAAVKLYFYRRDGKNGKPLKKGGIPVSRIPLSLPAVTAGAFEAADGSVGVFLVNTTTEPQQAVVALPPERRVTMYSATREVLRGATTGDHLSLKLEPVGVRILLWE
ncbi:MAG: hypothetical protein GXP31_02520 [Kiritimatiellaeota bacterium]|nr:hypothetical protein [Kiritimatiellota bacterium]